MNTQFCKLPTLCFGVVAALVLCLPTTSESGGKDKKFKPHENHLKGKARWEWTLWVDGKEADKGKFMGYVDGKICHGKDQVQIGTWQRTKNVGTIAASFTTGRLEGSWTFVMTKALPPTYEGTEKSANKKVLLEILND